MGNLATLQAISSPMSNISLAAARAETKRLADQVADSRFGIFVPGKKEIGNVAAMRTDLHQSATDGAVSEIDLLKLGRLLTLFAEAAQAQRASLSPEVIKRDYAVTVLGLEENVTEAQIAEEMAKVEPGFVQEQIAARTKYAEACDGYVLTLTALHGAIQTQLDAQPGLVSALEYIKDNGERFGVNGKLRELQKAVQALPHAEISEGALDLLREARKKAEGLLGKLFGDR